MCRLDEVTLSKTGLTQVQRFIDAPIAIVVSVIAQFSGCTIGVGSALGAPTVYSTHSHAFNHTEFIAGLAGVSEVGEVFIRLSVTVVVDPVTEFVMGCPGSL